MWSANDYGSLGVTSDSGGGYMTSTSSNSSQKKDSNQGSIIPCTCAEIMAASQDGDKCTSPCGMELSQVSVVGIIRSVNESSTRVEYEIDDYTGPYLAVKMFMEDQDNTPAIVQFLPLRELSYVRVHGHVRIVNGIKNILAFRVILLSDMNELTVHIMEVIYTRMLYIKIKYDEDNETNNTIFSEDGAHNTTGAISNGLTVLQNQILAIVRTFVGERGIPVSQLIKKLHGIPERQIRRDLDFLTTEGHVYSTVDDNHFRATEA
ncbi:unnamed protein product [Trichobilharzia szidati]|nr:unnamed protein product [Trichobilharzia szidati]